MRSALIIFLYLSIAVGYRFTIGVQAAGRLRSYPGTIERLTLSGLYH